MVFLKRVSGLGGLVSLPNIRLCNDEYYQYTVRWYLRRQEFRQLGPESFIDRRTY